MSVNLDTFAYSFPHPDGFTFLNKFCASDWTLKKSMKLALKMMRFLAHADGVNAGARSAQFLILERSWHRSQGKGGPNERPRTPAPGPITLRLRLDWLYPVLANSDGVGFETIRYYLIINTIKDLYCDVLQKIATTCDYAVTNCHEIHLPHFQAEILPKLPSPFDKENPDIQGLSSFL